MFWNPVTRKEVISDSAQFDERVFPGTSKTPVDLRVKEVEDLPEQGGVEIEADVLPAPPPPPAPAQLADPPAPSTMPTPDPTPSPPPSPPHSAAPPPHKRSHPAEPPFKRSRPNAPLYPDSSWRPIRHHTTQWWEKPYEGERMPRSVPGSSVPPQHFNFPESSAPPHSTPQPEVVEQPDQDIDMDSDSSDELDVMSEEEL